jgi:hypothetical protein
MISGGLNGSIGALAVAAFSGLLDALLRVPEYAKKIGSVEIRRPQQ